MSYKKWIQPKPLLSTISHFPKWLLLIAALIMGITIFYVWEGRDWVLQILEGDISSWQTEVIQFLYPRFSVEIQRLSKDFFLQKADQLVLRINALSFLGLLFFALYRSSIYKVKISAFWDKQASVSGTKYLVRLFYTGIFLFTKDWLSFLLDYNALTPFYKPFSFNALLQIPFPSANILYILWSAYAVSIVCVALWIKPLWFSIIASSIFIFLQSFLYSFEKINHAFATTSYAIIICPILVYYSIKAEKHGKVFQEAWAIVLIKLAVGIAYFQSGLEKAMNSGFNWFQNDFLLQTNISIGFFNNSLPLLVMGFQMSFILFTWKTPWQWIFLIGGVVFHFSTVWFINVGAFLNPWIFMYIFWIIKLKNH